MLKNKIKQTNLNKVRNALLVIGILFIAANLRFSLTPVGPLIGVIRSDFEFSSATAGLLTALPLLSFSIFSIFAPKIALKFKVENILMISLIILITGILLRSTLNLLFLMTGTFILGSAIAMGNVLLPSLIMDKLPSKAGIVTGLYTTSMNLFGAIASTLSFPISQVVGLGWQKTLALPSILVVIALIIWIPQLFSRTSRLTSKSTKRISLWKSSIAWYVTIFMGLQSLLYFVMLSWLPEIFIDKGMDPSKAGFMLGMMLLFSIPSNFIVPIIANRMEEQHKIMRIVVVITLIGLMGILLDGVIYASLWSILLGIGIGGCLSLSLMLITLRSPDAKHASELSGMAQSMGYLIASIGPVFFGFLYTITNSWSIPLFLLIVICIALLIVGIGAGKNAHVQGE